MKTIIKNTFLTMGMAVASVAFTSCLQEAFPESSTATESQIKDVDKSALVAAISGYMTQYSSGYSYDTGFPAHDVWRDSMTGDAPVYNDYYDYFPYFAMQTYLGNWELQVQFWKRYYYLLRNVNSVIRVSDKDPHSIDAPNLGTALVYRAMVYLDLMRMYEYKATGVAKLDEFAESEGLYGLTVPLITENSTEVEARNNPRIPFWHMYRFILNDLNLAEKCLADTHTAAGMDYCSLGVAYGMKARVWLEMGSRFQRYADDLQLQIQNEGNSEISELDALDIKTARDCFVNSAAYARKAINEGCTPLTEAEWYDVKSGFNTPNHSWMWAVIVNANNGLAKSCTWQSMPSYLAPEASYGVSHYVYGAYRMIDARLYEKVNRNDWRRTTWIDPEEAGDEEAYNTKYSKITTLSFADWSQYEAYAGFKFRPGSGDGETATQGNVFDTPLMRVEEMYLIEAEAIAMTQGPGAGMDALKTFMNSYRMNSGSTFNSRAVSIDEVVEEILTQKRIELWGEGQVLWDFRRLEKAIEKGYPGTNHVALYRFNSYPEKVAPWTTLYIPDYVHEQNPACKMNPDPSDALPRWVE